MSMYREGFTPLPGVIGIHRLAEWSDAFFSYVPAEQAWPDESIILEAAAEFIAANPACPYTAEYLAKDFRKRV